jgi:hypothetical protein
MAEHTVVDPQVFPHIAIILSPRNLIERQIRFVPT